MTRIDNDFYHMTRSILTHLTSQFIFRTAAKQCNVMAIWNTENNERHLEAISFQTNKDYSDYEVGSRAWVISKIPRQSIYTCKICGNHFKTASNLTTHTAVLSHEKPYSCDVYGKWLKWFQGADHLRDRRKLNIDENRYPCQVCGQAFTRASGFARHAVTHTGAKPYACNICGERFNTLHRCKEHKKIRPDERCFLCQFYGKSFKLLENL